MKWSSGREWKIAVHAATIGLVIGLGLSSPGLIGATASAGSMIGPQPALAAAPLAEDDDDAPESEASDEPVVKEGGGGGGAKNVVHVRNRSDGRLRVRGRIQLNRIPGPNVEPVNLALAYGSCTGCQTYAVALQIDLISRTADRVAPQNAAVAVNYECTDCKTVATAIQYVISVDDPTEVPHDVRELIRDMEMELRVLSKDKSISVTEAEARINLVVGRFQRLAEGLRQERDEKTETTSPNAEPPASASPVTAPLEPAGTVEATLTPTPTVTPEATPISAAPDGTLGTPTPTAPVPLPTPGGSPTP